MKAYLAASFRRRFELRNYRSDLLLLNIACIPMVGYRRGKRRPGGATRMCIVRFGRYTRRADLLIGFQDAGRAMRCGHAFEQGYAYALGKRLIIVGVRSHVFFITCRIVLIMRHGPQALAALRMSQ